MKFTALIWAALALSVLGSAPTIAGGPVGHPSRDFKESRYPLEIAKTIKALRKAGMKVTVIKDHDGEYFVVAEFPSRDSERD